MRTCVLQVPQQGAAETFRSFCSAGYFYRKKNSSRKRQPAKMATGVDQAVGMSLVVFSLLLFTYYSVWVIILPFMDSDHILHTYFLPREYSVILPGIAAVILLLCIGAFTAVIMWKNRKPKKVD
ncbi:hypothetical protein NQZ68_019959 [Dissostichus eleginoides]|nr:hypothetical protein NQZ68_019959 [Dissostichus eleginoides]